MNCCLSLVVRLSAGRGDGANGRRAWRALRVGGISSIWQLILKHEFWILLAVWAGLMVAHETTGTALLPGFATMVFILAVTLLAMHPMWKKGEQREDD